MCYDAHEAWSHCTNLYIYSSYKSSLLRWYCNPSTLQTFSVFMPSPLCLFRCFPIFSEPVLLSPTSITFLCIHSTWAMDSTINQLTRAKTVIYSDNSPWHKPSYIMNHYTYQTWQSSNLRCYCDMNHYMNHYTHLYGKAVIYTVNEPLHALV